ncbi:MAG TPA: PRC-barrel domain-containing protein [Gammaproteobacteria bacterium]|nr:PRC-barrel domain-containing protein [Gammaproteobacteria bacterium]
MVVAAGPHAQALLPGSRKPLRSAAALIGEAVRDERGKRIGAIEDLLLDVSGERVAYLVLAIGGMLGIGSRLLAIVPDMLERNRSDDGLRLKVTRRALDEAPDYDRTRWMDLAASPQAGAILRLRAMRSGASIPRSNLPQAR